MEMHYFWLLDGEAQKYFAFHHHPGQENLEITTQNPSPQKTHNMPDHFMRMKTFPPRNLVRALLPSTRRGCVETSRDSYIGRNPLPKLRTHKPTRTTRVLQTVVA